MFTVTNVAFLPPGLVFLLVYVAFPAGHTWESVRGGSGTAAVGPGGWLCAGLLGVGLVGDVRLPPGYSGRVGGWWVAEVVVLQPTMAVYNTGRSHWLRRLHVSLDGVHAIILRLAVRHTLVVPGLLLLFRVVPPPLLLTLGAGGASAASVRGAAASPVSWCCEESTGGDHLVICFVCHLALASSHWLTLNTQSLLGPINEQ